jgi:WD40 repeat protein
MDWVQTVAYSPNGQHIISGSRDKTIRIWDAETGAAIGTPLEGHISGMCALLPILPMGSTSSLDPVTRPFESGMPRLVLHLATLWRGTLMGCVRAYSPDGRHIISGSVDTTIRIWDAETGAAVGKPLQGHTGMCGLLLALPMDDTSSPDLMMGPFESGMLRLVLQ